jgi:hypothetical protein
MGFAEQIDENNSKNPPVNPERPLPDDPMLRTAKEKMLSDLSAKDGLTAHEQNQLHDLRKDLGK